MSYFSLHLIIQRKDNYFIASNSWYLGDSKKSISLEKINIYYLSQIMYMKSCIPLYSLPHNVPKSPLGSFCNHYAYIDVAHIAH